MIASADEGRAQAVEHSLAASHRALDTNFIAFEAIWKSRDASLILSDAHDNKESAELSFEIGGIYENPRNRETV